MKTAMHLHVADVAKDNNGPLQAEQDKWEGREDTQEWADKFGFYEADLDEVGSPEEVFHYFEGKILIEGREYHIRVGYRNKMAL